MQLAVTAGVNLTATHLFVHLRQALLLPPPLLLPCLPTPSCYQLSQDLCDPAVLGEM